VRNTANGEQVPLYIADYVLANVGTGVVMGVPAHDARDFAFAQKFALPIRQVVSYADQALDARVRAGETSCEADGTLVNSGKFDGQRAWGEGKAAIAEALIKQGVAEWKTTYKLRDWLISRQRYWGAPIPIVYDPQGRPHPVKDEHLPWLLPEDVDFRPTGESPLTRSKAFLDRTEELYGKGWRPEFDTMDTFVDSSWYFLRYTDARNTKAFGDPERIQAKMPVDLYLIGPEHIVLHLLYSRFFTKFLRDEGYFAFGEPFMKMRHQGMILGPDGKKMSKSKGNVINPDDVIEKFGADTLRVYEMFMGPLEADKPWDTRSVVGIYRCLQTIAKMVGEAVMAEGAAHAATQAESESLSRLLHQTVHKIAQDIPALKFNTAIAAMMIFLNAWEKAAKSGVHPAKDELNMFVRALAPFAPFLAEELFAVLGESTSVHHALWPVLDPAKLHNATVTIAIQVNGKLRGQVEVPTDDADNQTVVETMAKGVASVSKHLEGKQVRKTIVVPKKVVNFVVG
jgi:leucyl-tRNA synthetase